MGIPSGSSRMTARRATPKLFVSRPTRGGPLPTEHFMLHLRSRRVEVTTGIRHVGAAAWQACQQLQIVKLPPSVISLAEGAFLGCYVLREVAAPGCIRYGPRVFAECCSLSRVGASHGTEDNSVLAPGAQLGKYAFESCLTLATITFDMDHTNKPRGLPEGAFCGACIEQLCLPSDFHNIGPRACENCKSLVEVNLMDTEITALPSSTFAHCVALNSIWLPPRLTLIGKEVFPELCGAARSCHPDGAQGYRQPCILWGVSSCNDSPPWTGVTLNSGYKQSTMPFLCVTSLKNPSGWSCSLQRGLIRMLLTRNSTTNVANIMPAHGRL